jgi:hypothetical protein
VKRCLFDGWLGTDDGKGFLSVPGELVADDLEVVAQHPAQFEDVAPAQPAEDPDPEPEPDPEPDPEPEPAKPAKATKATPAKAAPAAAK